MRSGNNNSYANTVKKKCACQFLFLWYLLILFCLLLLLYFSRRINAIEPEQNNKSKEISKNNRYDIDVYTYRYNFHGLIYDYFFFGFLSLFRIHYRFTAVLLL